MSGGSRTRIGGGLRNVRAQFGDTCYLVQTLLRYVGASAAMNVCCLRSHVGGFPTSSHSSNS